MKTKREFIHDTCSFLAQTYNPQHAIDAAVDMANELEKQGYGFAPEPPKKRIKLVLATQGGFGQAYTYCDTEEEAEEIRNRWKNDI